MPIYAFACQACGHAFDSLQKMSDPDPAECTECGAAQIKRQLTAPSFRLAGAGWYETDFKKDGDRKRNIAGDGGESKAADSASTSKDIAVGAKDGAGKNEGGSAKETSGKSDTKPESKPAAKAEGTPSAKPESKPSAKSGETG